MAEQMFQPLMGPLCRNPCPAWPASTFPCQSLMPVHAPSRPSSCVHQGSSPAEPTEYSKARPRRQGGQRAVMGDTSESLDLTCPKEFVGPPGSAAPLAQPFAVVTSSQVGCKYGVVALSPSPSCSTAGA